VIGAARSDSRVLVALAFAEFMRLLRKFRIAEFDTPMQARPVHRT
jgi:hypothetical protein